ncbi:NAD(P)-dependent oxidoreductase [Mesorhizobium sp. INR15]|uniref:NAD-dependent epimerase/dehydratase family protein n=1 Tax=Mesorhizobium sp. INR15 TaxID=2654248 RepID=UPI001896A188|nr:NAD-dependent epimerase/dehydratase family protein [Mesorhizobium sp. INR15]QPC91709.1 NAD-dependent epimerase/dehydratase family protein [Mesorhizobium sp. INR15]
MASILVTGGLGYTGRTIVRQLAAQGINVVSYNRDYSELATDFVTAVQGELYDVPRLVRTIEKYGVDRIIHTAAMSHPDLSIDLPLTTVVANIDGTVNVMEAMRLAGIKRLVNFSSETVYGNHAGPIDENSTTTPTTPYGVTKVAIEHFGRVYNELYGLQTVSLRFSEVYGPGNRMPQILRDIVKTVLRGEPFVMESGSDHLFHFIHTEDVAHAAILAATSETMKGSVFNIFGDHAWTLAQSADLLRKFLPRASISIGPGYCHLDRQGPWDQSAAIRELGYAPQYTLEDGLARYVDWLKTNEY